MDGVQLSGKSIPFGLQANGLPQTVLDRFQHFMLDHQLFGNAVVSHCYLPIPRTISCTTNTMRQALNQHKPMDEATRLPLEDTGNAL
jgi:hypothetical protein